LPSPLNVTLLALPRGAVALAVALDIVARVGAGEEEATSLECIVDDVIDLDDTVQDDSIAVDETDETLEATDAGVVCVLGVEETVEWTALSLPRLIAYLGCMVLIVFIVFISLLFGLVLPIVFIALLFGLRTAMAVAKAPVCAL
jgi:hypothetical protein